MGEARTTCDGAALHRADVASRGMIAPALDAILILVVVEAGGFAVWHARTGAGIAPRDLLPNLAAGFFLVLAARVALGAGQPGPATTAALAASLFAALLAHLIDLGGRWRRR